MYIYAVYCIARRIPRYELLTELPRPVPDGVLDGAGGGGDASGRAPLLLLHDAVPAAKWEGVTVSATFVSAVCSFFLPYTNSL